MIHNAVDRALGSVNGYEQAEAFASDVTVHTVYIDGTRISNIETKRESGLMVRIADKGRQGKASVVLSSDDSVPECVRMAETVLRFSPAGPERSFTVPSNPRISQPDVWDSKVSDISSDDLRGLAKRLIDSCDVDIPRAQIRFSTCETHVVNSNGVDSQHRSTMVYGHFTSMFRGDKPGEGVETFHGTSCDIPLEQIGASISRQARDSASATGFKGHESLSMILPPGQLGEMLLTSMGAAINGENVKYGTSLWKESVENEVASSVLNVTDDPAVPAPLSCAFDDEGTPTEKRIIIDKGVLKGFLMDSFCGESTGNGMRRSSVEPQGAFERTPVVKPLNLSIAPGRHSREDIISQTENGILVERFANPEADELSGRFGLNVRCGYIIRHGEVVSVVNNALLAGNMLDALKNIEHIGCDSTQTGVITVPTMSFSGAELIGDRPFRMQLIISGSEHHRTWIRIRCRR